MTVRPITKEEQKLVVKNQKLVWAIIYKLHISEELQEDMFQAGIMGLMAAVRRYDPNRAALSTFAYPSIISYIFRAKSKLESNIHIPIYIRTKARKDGSWNTLKERLKTISMDQEELIFLRTDDLSEQLNVKIDQQILKKKIDLFLKTSSTIVTKNNTWKSKITTDTVYKIAKKYSLEGKTLEAIAQEQHLTRERIRQINNKVIKNLTAFLNK